MQNLPITVPVYKRISKAAQQELAAFEARSTDVFVCSPPKTGTTLMQVVCHLLRGGDDEYVDLYEGCRRIWSLGSTWVKRSTPATSKITFRRRACSRATSR